MPSANKEKNKETLPDEEKKTLILFYKENPPLWDYSSSEQMQKDEGRVKS